MSNDSDFDFFGKETTFFNLIARYAEVIWGGNWAKIVHTSQRENDSIPYCGRWTSGEWMSSDGNDLKCTKNGKLHDPADFMPAHVVIVHDGETWTRRYQNGVPADYPCGTPHFIRYNKDGNVVDGEGLGEKHYNSDKTLDMLRSARRQKAGELCAHGADHNFALSLPGRIGIDDRQSTNAFIKTTD